MEYVVPIFNSGPWFGDGQYNSRRYVVAIKDGKIGFLYEDGEVINYPDYPGASIEALITSEVRSGQWVYFHFNPFDCEADDA